MECCLQVKIETAKIKSVLFFMTKTLVIISIFYFKKLSKTRTISKGAWKRKEVFVMRRKGPICAFIAHLLQYGLLSLSKHQQHGRFNEEIRCPNGNLLVKGKAGSILYTIRSITVASIFSFNLSPFSTQRSNLVHRRRQFLTHDLSLWLRKQIALNSGQNDCYGKQRDCFSLTKVGL